MANLIAQEIVPFSSRETKNNIHGNLIMTGNAIVGLVDSDEDNSSYNPNASYDGMLNNGNSISAYIDIDGDPSTFSSSSANISVPSPYCSTIVYAGLYWGATYYLERVCHDGDEQVSDLPLVDARKIGDADFRKIKLRVPGGQYSEVTAQNIIYDGYRNTPTNPSNVASDDVPYVCYADVTGLIDQNNIDGTYTVANMNATIGRTSSVSGAGGGWTLVVIYEDPLESVKFISTSDGFVQANNSGPDIDFTFSGFTTVSAPSPVNVKYGVAALEGDRGIGATDLGPNGDQLLLQNTANPPAFIALGEDNLTPAENNDINPTINFFNSSITLNHQYITNRYPASENTLGLDIDLFDISNPNNSLIDNDQTSATFRFSTDADSYRVFLNAFVTEIVKPELRIVQKVLDADGITDINGANVSAGATLWYKIEIENIGNEDLVDGMINVSAVLPANTNLVAVDDATLPAGIIYTMVSENIINFNIPANIVEVNDTSISIRYNVMVASNCEELTDTCSNILKSNAIANYVGGTTGKTRVSYSSTGIGACGNDIGESTTNILTNIPVCSSDVTLCGDSLTLVAGTGFDMYTWSGPGIVDPIVTTTNFMNVLNPQQGTYVVVKESTDGSCMSLTEEFEVSSNTSSTLNVDITTINPINSEDDGTIIVKILEDNGSYTIVLDNDITIENAHSTHEFNNVSIGNHELKVYDIANCTLEEISVDIEGAIENPLIEYADEILLCTNTNQSYPVIEIRGREGEELNIPFANIESVVWQKLNEVDCDIELQYNCPTTGSNCSSDWFDVSTDKNFTVVDDGRYRVIVTFASKSQNSSANIYYYKVINNLPASNDEGVLFPNPGREVITINDEVKSVKIFNAVGKLVLETTKNKFTIIELESGVYFARVVTGTNEERVVKLIKN
ncbi:T9SS type A sorting domain-containing protein [Aquimarina sp. 2201CG1-2-11]|uniref:T9SS type A sorting domain-containing protein n=1 Tax=Aquimarina discodermiae TaxID=3231043 RepID=UPI003461C740